MFEVLEFIGGFVFFAFMGILSLILLPSLLGCFGFILFWVVILGLVVFFSVNFIWFFALAIIIYSIVAVRKFIRYQKLPIYDDYLNNNVNVYADGRARCCHCGSDQLIAVGLFGFQSRWRYYMCMHCRRWLYKFKVI